jgi:Uma2 family endonuclease
MVEAKIVIPRTLPAGEIIAMDVSEEDYMELYAGDFCEWVDGVVIKMSPVSGKHDDLTGYLRELFRAYFALKPIGKTRSAPFVMRLAKPKSRREPDLQIILKDNPGTLHDTYMDGPADICIEVVSLGTESTDYGDKFKEYEVGGVSEYWIIDPRREACQFYRLNEKQVYQLQAVDDEGVYSTPKLPSFKLHVPTLWQDELPNFYEVAEAVKAMVKETP